MKKVLACAVSALMLTALLAGCGGENTNDPSGTDTTDPSSGSSAMSGAITVLSREEGSGTRSAFEELFGMEETIASAETTNSTGVMMTTVAGNKSAIGYISLGSLDDTVKAISIDGAEPSVANVENGSYKVSRPFNIATKSGLSEVAQDFVNFIMSDEGQKVVEDEGYIPQESTGAFSGTNPSGTVSVNGSSSVTPLMEKLKEAYEAVNTNATIEINQTDSSTGMSTALEGVCDIGMASRALKDEELSGGLTATCIATDGIAVIVNKENSVDGLTSDQVKGIYTGEITDWSGVAE